MKIEIPDPKLVLREKIKPRHFDITIFRKWYEEAVETKNQLTVLIVGLKGDGKTSLATQIIDTLDLPIDRDYFIKDVVELAIAYKQMLRGRFRPPYLVFDDVGNISDKWTRDRITILLNKIYSLDRPLCPMYIMTDTYQLSKHFRTMSKIMAWVTPLNKEKSLARFYRLRRNPFTDGIKPKRLGYYVFIRRMPDDIYQMLNRSRYEELEELVDELILELLNRGHDHPLLRRFKR